MKATQILKIIINNKVAKNVVPQAHKYGRIKFNQ